MPEVPENLDKLRFEEIRRKCVRGATLWLNLMQAADNQKPDSCKTLWGNIRDTSVEVSDIIKALGAEKRAANGNVPEVPKAD